MIKKYNNPYGTWDVRTEGDVEGRTINHLGTYTGYIDEIALHLADKCFYSLIFKNVEPVQEYKPTSDSVNIFLDINSGTWPMVGEQRLKYFEELFKNRNVNVVESNYYASVKIEAKKTQEEIKAEKKQKALDKLSEEEKELLGLK